MFCTYDRILVTWYRILVTWYRILVTWYRIRLRILRTVQNICTLDRILYPVQCRTVKSTEFWISVVQNSRARPEFWTLSRVLYLHTEFAYVFWVLCTFTGHVTEFWTRYVRILYNLPKFWKLVYRIQYQNSAYVLCPMMWQIILVNLNNSG